MVLTQDFHSQWYILPVSTSLVGWSTPRRKGKEMRKINDINKTGNEEGKSTCSMRSSPTLPWVMEDPGIRSKFVADIYHMRFSQVRQKAWTSPSKHLWITVRTTEFSAGIETRKIGLKCSRQLNRHLTDGLPNHMDSFLC